MVGYVDPSSGHAYPQSTCQEILFEARAGASVDFVGFSAVVARAAAQRASARNPEVNRM